MNAVIPQKEASLGQQYLDDIRHRNFARIEASIDPAYRGDSLRGKLEKMASIFPTGPVKSFKVVGSNTVMFNGQTTYNFTYEYEFPHSWVLGHIYYKKTGNEIVIERMDVYPFRKSLEEINAFTLSGKSPLQLAFLATAALLFAFTIGTAIVAFRTPIPERKWLWIVFVLFGVVQLSMNWTTGAVNYAVISFALFATGFVQQFYGPAIIQIALPLGAIIFWLKRPGWIEDANSRAEVIRKVYGGPPDNSTSDEPKS